MKISRRDFLQMTGAATLAATPLSTAIADVLTGSTRALPRCGLFDLPPRAGRPRFRWWWPGGYITPEQVEKEVNAMADAGFGGFEIADVRDGLMVPMDPKEFGWGSERWVAGVEKALEVAARRGLKADITLGAHWPTGMPGVTPDDPAAAKELVHAEAAVQGGQRYSGLVPVPTSQPSGARQHRTPPKVTPMLVALQAWRESGQQDEQVVLDPASRIDLTDQVEDGAIDWIAPADGAWRLLAFWMRGTAQIQNMFGMNKTTSMLADPVPYVVDVYGKAGTQACIDYWEAHLLPPRTRELLKRIGGNLFEDSLELNAIEEWSPDLPAEFRARRGYGLLPYLPLMAVGSSGSPGEGGFPPGPGRAVSPYAIAGVESERFEADLRKTLTEMYALNRIKALSEWAATLGMGLRAQCSGLAASYCTVPEGDNGDNIASFSAKAAARDIGGHQILSDEAATFVGGQSGVADWRLLIFMLQRDFAGGVNQVVLHGFSYADAPDAVWPGFSAFGRAIGNDWGPRSPLWEMAPDAAAYIGRLQSVLQAGRSQADVAVLDSPAEGGIAEALGRSGSGLGDQLRIAGYTAHHLTPDLLTHPNAVVEDGRLAPRGAGYHALIVPQARMMEAATAQRLLQYATDALPIILVGDLPADVPGLNELELQRDELRAALTELIDSPSVTRVPTPETLMNALRAAGIEPSLGFSKLSRVLGIVRRDDDTDYFYFLNDSDAANSLTLSLKGEGRPVRIDLWTGSIEPVAVYTSGNGRVDIPVAFDPNEAVALALTTNSRLCNELQTPHAVSGDNLCVVDGRLSVRATKSGRYRATLPGGQTAKARVGSVPAPRELSDWMLQVEDWRPGDTATETKKVYHTLVLDRLAPWTALPNLEGVSGIGCYTAAVKLDEDWSGDHGAWLELGRVGGTFRVSVNGQQLPPANQFTARVDVSPWLRPGDNRIEVVVATPLNNRFKALDLPAGFSLPGGMQFAAAKFSADWRPPADADPLQPPRGEYLGAPVQGDAGGPGPRMAPGAGNPGGARSQQDYGLMGPVRLVPYRTAPLSAR